MCRKRKLSYYINPLGWKNKQAGLHTRICLKAFFRNLTLTARFLAGIGLHWGTTYIKLRLSNYFYVVFTSLNLLL